MNNFATRLNNLIDSNNVKQVDIIKKTGISKSLISAYVAGEYIPKNENLYKLAKYFNVNEMYLLGLDDDPVRIDDADRLSLNDSPKNILISKIYNKLKALTIKQLENIDKYIQMVVMDDEE